MNAVELFEKIERIRAAAGGVDSFTLHRGYKPFRAALDTIRKELGVEFESWSVHTPYDCEKLVRHGADADHIYALAVLCFQGVSDAPW